MTSGTESRIESKLDALLVTVTRMESDLTNRVRQIDDHEVRIRELENAEKIAALESRVEELALAQQTIGRFTWSDVWKVVGGLAAGGGMLALFVSLVAYIVQQ